jgi:hypothetical protein
VQELIVIEQAKHLVVARVYRDIMTSLYLREAHEIQTFGGFVLVAVVDHDLDKSQPFDIKRAYSGNAHHKEI